MLIASEGALMARRKFSTAFGESEADFFRNRDTYKSAQIADWKNVLYYYSRGPDPQEAIEALERYGHLPIKNDK